MPLALVAPPARSDAELIAACVAGDEGAQRALFRREYPRVHATVYRLLGTEGFLGVKTGTPDAAGACLVACEERDGRELIVVILGATSSDARYVDARNLFRWAWTERK